MRKSATNMTTSPATEDRATLISIFFLVIEIIHER